MTPRKRKGLPVAAIAGTLVLCAYFAYQARGVMLGPSITLVSPLSYATVREAETVAGTARGVARISLNGYPITVDEKGGFRERLVLPTGSSILTLAVTDRFGRTEEKRIAVYREGQEPPVTTRIPEPQASSSTASTTESLP
jgi:hypothetical protein